MDSLLVSTILNPVVTWPKISSFDMIYSKGKHYPGVFRISLALKGILITPWRYDFEGAETNTLSR